MIQTAAFPTAEDIKEKQRQGYFQTLIERGEQTRDNPQQRKNFIDEIFRTFRDMPEFYYNNISEYTEQDLNVCIGILNKYKFNTSFQKNGGNIIVSTENNNNNSNKNIINITIANTIEQINQINDNNLNAESKIELQNMLLEIEQLKNGKDKKTLWDKIKAASLWVLDKGADVLVATMPYLLGLIH